MSTTDDILKEMDEMEKAEIEKSPSRKLQMMGYAKRRDVPQGEPSNLKRKLSQLLGGK